jgi:hypothetical protein
MLVGLLRREAALAHELLDERVVVREALEPPVAQAVEAAVADVRDGELGLADVGDRQRRAHARALVVRTGELVDAAVGLAHALGQALLDAAGPVGQALLEDLDGQPGGDFAGLRPAHPVGDREQRRAREVRVLVGLALAARVGPLDVLGHAQHLGHLRGASCPAP